MNEIIEKIDVSLKLSIDDFLLLFTEQLSLTDEEIEKLRNLYYPFYIGFISADVDPQGSWIAIRNLFISQETQIDERPKK
jgi:hypothetical protein